MKSTFAAAMRRATQSTRAGNLGDAMRAIHAALGGTDALAARRTVRDQPGATRPAPSLRLIEGDLAATAEPEPAHQYDQRHVTGRERSPRVRRPLRDVLAAIRKGRVSIDPAA